MALDMGFHSFLKAAFFVSALLAMFYHAICSIKYNNGCKHCMECLYEKVHGLGVEEIFNAIKRNSLQEHEMDILVSPTFQQLLLLYDEVVENSTSCLHDQLPLCSISSHANTLACYQPGNKPKVDLHQCQIKPSHLWWSFSNCWCVHAQNPPE